MLAKPNNPAIGRSGTEFIARWQSECRKDPKIFLGYPVNRNIPARGYFDWQNQLASMELGMRSYNNIGDPYEWSEISAPHFLETQVIDDFAERLGYPAAQAWGFVSNGGTESNLHGLYMGLNLLKSRYGKKPRLFYTADAHYSIQVIQNLLGLDAVFIASNPGGAMDCEDLKLQLERNTDAPVLLLATLGTTFTGAMDDLVQIHRVLHGKAYYVHLDAALFGGYLPLTPYKHEVQVYHGQQRLYDSIAISCHKFFGFPLVAGLFICERRQFDEFRCVFSQVHDPAYISHVPGTLTTSRDSLKPALFHYFTSQESKCTQASEARNILRCSAYLFEQLSKNFAHLNARRESDASSIVHFDMPCERLVRKWSLATVEKHGEVARAHAVLMPHVTQEYLDYFLSDLKESMWVSEAE